MMKKLLIVRLLFLSLVLLSVVPLQEGHADPVSCTGDAVADINQFIQSRSEALVCVLGANRKLPGFPGRIPGFKTRLNMDFWGNSFAESGSVRVFEGDAPQSITDCSSNAGGCSDFPDTQNSCGKGLFIVRWRTDNPDVRISSFTEFGRTVPSPQKAGKKGYIIGSNCHRPLFGFDQAEGGNGANLADVVYEVRFWQTGL